MKRTLILVNTVFSLSLSSCFGHSFRTNIPFQVLESDDGVFKSFANIKGYENSEFYATVNYNSESFLLYCFPKRARMMSRLFSVKGEINDYHHLNISNRDDEIEMFFGSYGCYVTDDPSFANWKSIASFRDVSDEELDVRYYTEVYYTGLEGKLILETVQYLIGFLIDEQGKKNSNLLYYDKSSIFTFKLLCYYNDETYVFSFLEGNNFSIRKDNDIVATGNYLSRRDGMDLLFTSDSIFNLDTINLTIDTSMYFASRHFYNKGKTIPTEIDLSKYINSDYEFWIQQYEAENS